MKVGLGVLLLRRSRVLDGAADTADGVRVGGGQAAAAVIERMPIFNR